MHIYILISVIIAALSSLARSKAMARALSGIFVAFQLGFAAVVALKYFGTQSFMFFEFDHLGVLFFVLMAFISALAFHASAEYNSDDDLHKYKLYNVAMIMLCMSSACVYFTNNVAVSWIFLEATTLCTAALVYHRRDLISLEATWKYIFVCSIGITMAYLGILLISSYAQGDISYDGLVYAIASGDTFYMKAAFILIMTGYSCKMEIFPLFTVGIDANYAAPTPASSMISTVLVNAGFVAIFRMLEIFTASEIGQWCSNVLIVIGVLSVAIGALYIRRTNNYKRLFAYSTTENMGLVMIGIGLGGIGLVAAFLHLVVHSLLKSGMFTLMSQLGRVYGNYRINRMGGYARINPIGAAAILIGALSLTAFPPSGLFVSEIMIFSKMIETQRWWLVVLILALLCIVIYSILVRIIQLCFRRRDISKLDISKVHKLTTYGAALMILAALVIGALQPSFITDYILSIIE